MNLLEKLNKEQKDAVLAFDGPILINAGAGSGKTRVLTTRIALLLESGIPANRILALTFTKKAAGEMRKRIAQMTSKDTSSLVMGTFHSVFIKFLRQYAQTMGYPDNFTIYDEDDSESCMKEAIRQIIWGFNWEEERKGAGDKDPRHQLEKKYKLKYVMSRISLAKNNMYNAEGYVASPEIAEEDNRYGYPLMGQIFKLYSDKCRQAGAMDFDDILLNTEILLARNYDAFNDFASRFDYILVDEYQDTNYVQYSILKRLTAHNKNICVVGDDSQSIYGFRGAKIENILNFKRDYPNCKEYRLETNYRSTSQIVDAANRLIVNNENRLPKECRSNAGQGEGITIKSLATDREEADYVANIIRQATFRDKNYGDFSIIYRTNAQSRLFEDALIRNKIPYTIFSGTSFFQRAEVKDALAYFKLCINSKDNEAFKRACSRPKRGIGVTSLSEFINFVSEYNYYNQTEISLYDMILSPAFNDCKIKDKAKENLRKFVAYIDSISFDTLLEDAYTIGSKILQTSGLYDYYRDDDERTGKKKCENLEEVVSMLLAFVDGRKAEGNTELGLDSFLDDIALLSNADTRSDDDTPKVSLMTAHCSKGLEFPYVFVVGAEEKLFPAYKDDEITPLDLEEERRLFYVAITRAEQVLFITNADSRYKFNKREDTKPSRFLKEILG